MVHHHRLLIVSMSLELRLGLGPCTSLPQEQQELKGGWKRGMEGGVKEGRSKGVEWREKRMERRGREME